MLFFLTEILPFWLEIPSKNRLYICSVRCIEFMHKFKNYVHDISSIRSSHGKNQYSGAMMINKHGCVHLTI